MSNLPHRPHAGNGHANGHAARLSLDPPAAPAPPVCTIVLDGETLVKVLRLLLRARRPRRPRPDAPSPLLPAPQDSAVEAAILQALAELPAGEYRVGVKTADLAG